MALGLGLAVDLEHFVGLGRRVVEQTKRRVFWHEKVAASDKIVSIFEPHTDVIVKDRRQTLFGHKLCLTTGKSGLVLDCMRLDGNPADSTLAVTAMERQKAIFGRVPRQASFDGGFASKTNLDDIKTLGVSDIMFHKKRGLSVAAMVKSSWVYKKLKRFRAGIDAGISLLKRCFGLGRCLWRGELSFEAYTWASVVSANLLMLARHALS
jgi:IS5 family transposase